MKKLLIFLIMILLLPITTFASDIKITNIEVLSKSDTVTVNESTHDGLTGNLNFKVSEIGDSIKYKITIKNDSTEDFNINLKTNSEIDKYFDYAYTGDTKIEPGKEGTITVQADYVKNLEKEDIQESEYTSTLTLSLTSDTLTSNLENPNTGLNYKIIIITSTFCIIIGMVFYLYNKNNSIYKIFILLPILSIPFIVNATEEEVLKINVTSIVKVPTIIFNVAPYKNSKYDIVSGEDEGTNVYEFDEEKITSYEIPLKYSSTYDTNTVMGYTDITKEQLDSLIENLSVFEKSDTESINAKREEIIASKSGRYVTYMETSRTITYEYYASVNHTDEHGFIPIEIVAEYDKTTGKVRNITGYLLTIDDLIKYILENNTDVISCIGEDCYFSNNELVTLEGIQNYAESGVQDFMIEDSELYKYAASIGAYLASGLSPSYSVIFLYDKEQDEYETNLIVSSRISEDKFIMIDRVEDELYIETGFVYRLCSLK